MVADLFLYVPSDITFDVEKNRSIVVENCYSNDYMKEVAQTHLSHELSFMSDLLLTTRDSLIASKDNEMLTPMTHYSIGKSGVFCPSPLSFLIDYIAVIENSGFKGLILNMLGGIDPFSDISRYMRSAFALNSYLCSLFESELSNLLVQSSSLTATVAGYRRGTGNAPKFRLSEILDSKSLQRLADSMSLQSFGSSKDRFSTQNLERDYVSFKKNLPSSTLCRNYTGLERSWKFRNILIVNTWIQQSLAYLHNIVFEALRGIRQDITYDQERIYDFVSKYGTDHLISLDLTDATTQQHTSIMEAVIESAFGDTVSRSFIRVIKEDLNVFFSKDLTLKYTSGSAQGTRSIWALFVIAHHIIIRKSYAMCAADGIDTKNPNSFPYILLGDNLTIVDRDYRVDLPIDQQEENVTGNYMMISNIFNGSFDHTSSWYPNVKGHNVHGIEIAKRYFFRNSNITPLPLNYFMPFEQSNSYQDFCLGVINTFKLGLIPRLRFLRGIKESRRLIVKTFRNLILLEISIFGKESSLVSFKICLYELINHKFKKNYDKCKIEIGYLANSLNSIMVSEFSCDTFFTYQYQLTVIKTLSILRESELAIGTAIPFQYNNLPEVFYLNYIAQKYLLKEVPKGMVFSDLSELTRNQIFSELNGSQHPLKGLCEFREKELLKISVALEKFLVVAFCLLSTQDLRYYPILKLLDLEIRSPLVETKSSFGIGKTLSKGYSFQSIYDVAFVSDILSSKGESDSVFQSKNQTIIRVYNMIVAKRYNTISTPRDIFIMGEVILQDHFSQRNS